MKNTTIFSVAILLIIQTYSCNKATEYEKFENDEETVYPGIGSNFKAIAGNSRVLLQWVPSPDQGISKYVIYWHNGADSLVLSPTTKDPKILEKVFINNLSEAEIYTFTIRSYNTDGKVSIPVILNNVRVLGDYYISGLHNRTINNAKPAIGLNSGGAIIYFNKADSLDVGTLIKFYKRDNVLDSVVMNNKADSIILNDYDIIKSGIEIRSSYITSLQQVAIDTFKVAKAETVPIPVAYLCSGLIQREGVADTIITNEAKTITYNYNTSNIYATILPLFNNASLTLYLRINTDNTVTILPNSGAEASLQITENGPCSFEPATNKFKISLKYLSGALNRNGVIEYVAVKR